MIKPFSVTEPDWEAFIRHLKRVKMARHSLKNEQPKPDTHYFGVTVKTRVVGHIAIRVQPLSVPVSKSTDGAPMILTRGGVALMETFVQTFAVEEAYQRRGYGRGLQQTAIDFSREMGCYQMRSWSSGDRQANYALKLSMGFAAVPGLYPIPGGETISGMYFVMILNAESRAR